MNRRWLAGIFAFVLFAGFAGIYFLIPGNLVIARVEGVRCNPSAAFRTISEDKNWNKWWPPQDRGEDSFLITGKFYHQVGLSFIKGDLRIVSKLTVLPGGGIDSTLLQWQCNFPSGLNPVTRIVRYREAVRIRDHMAVTLANLRTFLEKKENVYGIDIKEAMSRDSTLVATYLLTPSYPSTAEIYERIAAIRTYIAGQGAKEINHPMMNPVQKKDGSFETTIAIPTNKELKKNGSLLPQRYVPWKIMVGEIRGGPWQANKALEQLQQYVSDYQQSAMGTSFQSLVTERNQEPDTTRWITRVVQAVP
ncbi:hypothetical protein ACX0G9_10330 [Flavitalea flava]